MRLPIPCTIEISIAPLRLAAQEDPGTCQDRIAVEDVMAFYVWAMDSLDAGSRRGI